MKYLLIGICFGIVLVKSQVVSWFRIQEMFRLESFHMYGVIGSAVVVGVISLQLIKRLGIRTLSGEPIVVTPKKFHWGNVIGGLIFGLGWAITGACPGPLFALIGAGFGVVILTLLSAIAGTWVYGWMKERLPLVILMVLVMGAPAALVAQDKPAFWDDVQTIKAYDRMYEPPASPILFVGSSSIRKWNDLERTFASYVVMNRGIGGAVTNDITRYLDDIVFPYHPRQIVIYVGENDLPQQTTTADSVLARTKLLIGAIRAKLPEVPIVYISMKPSPSRDAFREKCKQANALIKAFIMGEKLISYVDIFSPMLDKDGHSRPELFVQDMLHMNAKGYAIWKAAVEPHLLKR